MAKSKMSNKEIIKYLGTGAKAIFEGRKSFARGQEERVQTQEEYRQVLMFLVGLKQNIEKVERLKR